MAGPWASNKSNDNLHLSIHLLYGGHCSKNSSFIILLNPHNDPLRLVQLYYMWGN